MSKQNKILIGVVSLIILVATGGVFFWVYQGNNLTKETLNAKDDKVIASDEERKVELQNSINNEVDAIKKDIDSISERDFDENTLSDAAVGL